MLCKHVESLQGTMISVILKNCLYENKIWIHNISNQVQYSLIPYTKKSKRGDALYQIELNEIRFVKDLAMSERSQMLKNNLPPFTFPYARKMYWRHT